MAKLTQDEKLKRTRSLLSAPTRADILDELVRESERLGLYERPKLQPRPDEIGYT